MNSFDPSPGDVPGAGLLGLSQRVPPSNLAADLIQQAGMFKFGAQGHRIGKLARFHAAFDGVENPPMHRISEVFRREIFAHTLKRLVIGQKRAQQRLFGGQIGWRNTLRQAEQTGPRSGAGRWVKIIHAPL